MKNIVKFIFFLLLLCNFPLLTSNVFASELSGVTIKYLDESTGKEIYPSNHLNEFKGSHYDVSSKKYQPTISGYSLVKVPDNAKGSFDGSDIEVCYYYRNSSKGRAISPSTLQDTAASTPYTGEYDSNDQEINKTGDSEEEGKVTIKYIDKITGREIHKTQTVVGNINSTYDVSTNQYRLDLSSEGYELDQEELPENVTGTFAENDTDVVYSYRVAPIELINGSFENPVIDSPIRLDDCYYQPFKSVPGWKTTATDSVIELLKSLSPELTAAEGKQWVELNGTQVSALYQDIKTVPGEIIYWEVSHRGRFGRDKALVEFGSPNGTMIEQCEMETDKNDWVKYKGFYTVPEGQEITRFQFRSISSSGGNPQSGNLLDDIVFTNIQSKITVHFVDEKGNKIKDSKEVIGFKGQGYDWSDTNAETEIEGYELDHEKFPSNVKGIFTETDQEITLTYKTIVEAKGYIEVPQKIQLHSIQEKGQEYVAGKGTIQYHSIEGLNDQGIEVFTDPEVTITSKGVNKDGKEEYVNVKVYHSDISTLVEKDKALGELSKTNSTYDFYLKALRKYFTKTNSHYEGRMIFKAKFK
ncbi:MucBP domain-containing protein [Enterococcus avium]|uniref:MucBP domain-containing protein n=1 Tax=Enterococcus avium TaxID=33945 RepID=UPI001F5815EA|nr:MucBP domain-containing protein [Enterococcus avium]